MHGRPQPALALQRAGWKLRRLAVLPNGRLDLDDLDDTDTDLDDDIDLVDDTDNGGDSR